MITVDTGTLPVAVASMLAERVAPVIEADARATVSRRMLAEARVEAERLRRDGYNSPVYTDGMDNAIRDTFGPDMGHHRVAAVLDADRGDTETGTPCECDSCTLDVCDGECERCDDHDCPQCGCGEGAAYSCCGYCPNCESHQGDSRDEVCNMGHCHDCDHRCNVDY